MNILKLCAFAMLAAFVTHFSVCALAADLEGASGMTKITITIRDKSFPAILYDNEAARELISRLPIKLSLSRGSRDYCGDIGEKLPYKKDDVHKGYKNGDLVYWIPGNDFVIFTEREDSSAEVDGCVTLGKLTGSLDELRNSEPSIEALIAPDAKTK